MYQLAYWKQENGIFRNHSMKSSDVAVDIYNSSNDELISEKLSIFLEHKDNIIKYFISILDDFQD